jgi:hypothetical protein
MNSTAIFTARFIKRVQNNTGLNIYWIKKGKVNNAGLIKKNLVFLVFIDFELSIYYSQIISGTSIGEN